MPRRTSQCLTVMFSLVAATILLSPSHAVAAQRPSAASRPVVLAIKTAHTHRSRWYTVRRGDTLAGIARSRFGHTSWWPGLWAVNRRWVRNPDMLLPGETLKLATRPLTGHESHLLHRLMNPAPPRHSAAQALSAPSRHYRCGDGDGDGYDMPCAHHAPAPAPAPAAVSYTGGGSFQQCVIARESGGNPSAVNPSSGAGGLYGFLPSTWAALGFPGLPENASVAMQNAAFAKEYAASGTAAWQPYDGC